MSKTELYRSIKTPLKIFKEVLSQHPDQIDAPCASEGNFPLIKAFDRSESNKVRLLIEAGADVTILYKKLTVLEVIATRAVLRMNGFCFKELLLALQKRLGGDRLKQILNDGSKGRTILELIIVFDHETALMINPQLEIRDAFEFSKHLVISLLIKYGACCDDFGHGDVSVLRLAVHDQFLDTILLILNNCSSDQVDRADIDGNSPLHIASTKENIRAVIMLLTYKANPSLTNKKD